MERVFQCPNCGSLVLAVGDKVECPIGCDLELEIIDTLGQVEIDSGDKRA
jgi:hypothetical protein